MIMKDSKFHNSMTLKCKFNLTSIEETNFDNFRAYLRAQNLKGVIS
jgi:hypothetical protein